MNPQCDTTEKEHRTYFRKQLHSLITV